MNIPRRLFIQSTLCAAGMVASGFAQSTGQPALRDVAKSSGLLFGAATGRTLLDNNADYAALVARECSIIVPENGLKWQTVRPSLDQFDFSEGDALLAFARKNGQVMRGHNLVWHEGKPAWFDSTITAKNARDLLTTHIKTVVSHYSGQLDSWDVVNEAISTGDGRPDGLRKTKWLSNIGPEYLDLAYQTAAAADPKAVLFYNDYGTEDEGDKSKAKREAILKLLSGFKSRGVPIHGFGFQSHLWGQWKPTAGLTDFVKSLAALGLKIYVTELDVNDYPLPTDLKARDEGVAEVYRSYLSTMLSEPAVKAVLCWGITDKYTWLNEGFGKPRQDKLRHRPLPFDEDLKPTLVYETLCDVFRKAPPR